MGPKLWRKLILLLYIYTHSFIRFELQVCEQIYIQFELVLEYVRSYLITSFIDFKTRHLHITGFFQNFQNSFFSFEIRDSLERWISNGWQMVAHSHNVSWKHQVTEALSGFQTKLRKALKMKFCSKTSLIPFWCSRSCMLPTC